MSIARKLAVVVAGSLLVVGCGPSTDTNSGCTVTPPLSRAPGSCSAQPGDTLDVLVNWCTCQSSVVCDVRDEGGGVIQLEPRIDSCDASCPSNPTDCPAVGVHCIVPVPSTAASYNLYIYHQDGYRNVPLQVSSGGSDSCS